MYVYTNFLYCVSPSILNGEIRLVMTTNTPSSSIKKMVGVRSINGCLLPHRLELRVRRLLQMNSVRQTTGYTWSHCTHFTFLLLLFIVLSRSTQVRVHRLRLFSQEPHLSFFLEKPIYAYTHTHTYVYIRASIPCQVYACIYIYIYVFTASS